MTGRQPLARLNGVEVPCLAWTLHLAAGGGAGDERWELLDGCQGHARVLWAVRELLVRLLPDRHPQGLLQLVVGFAHLHFTVVTVEAQTRESRCHFDRIGRFGLGHGCTQCVVNGNN
jgi:hypothetical protein